MAKNPAWARTPRHRLGADWVSNGWKVNGKNELLVSNPRIHSKLAELLGVDTATVDVTDNVDIIHFGKTVEITNEQIGDFIADKGAFIALPTSLTVTPVNPSVSLATPTQQMTATLNFDDLTTSVVTGSAVWVSANEAVATVDINGLVTALTQGTSVITATYRGFTDNTTVTVTA